MWIIKSRIKFDIFVLFCFASPFRLYFFVWFEIIKNRKKNTSLFVLFVCLVRWLIKNSYFCVFDDEISTQDTTISTLYSMKLYNFLELCRGWHFHKTRTCTKTGTNERENCFDNFFLFYSFSWCGFLLLFYIVVTF